MLLKEARFSFLFSCEKRLIFCERKCRREQCDQMARYFCNIWPFARMHINSYNSMKVGQIRFKSFPEYYPNLKQLPNTVKILPKEGNFHQIWSHWSWGAHSRDWFCIECRWCHSLGCCFPSKMIRGGHDIVKLFLAIPFNDSIMISFPIFALHIPCLGHSYFQRKTFFHHWARSDKDIVPHQFRYASLILKGKYHCTYGWRPVYSVWI